MRVVDLVEYIPSKQVPGLERIGVIMQVWHMDHRTQYLCHWNIPSTVDGKTTWYVQSQNVQLCTGGGK